jgi:hypothetical protein
MNGPGTPMIRQVTFALALMAAAPAYAQQPSWLPGAQYDKSKAAAPAYAQQPSWLPGAQYDKSIVDQQELTWPTISSEELEKFVGRYRILPPPKYDVPYTGKLTLVTSDDVASTCFNSTIACATHGQFSSCHIIMAPDELIISKGLDPLDVFRHEQGHCNGWPNDHRK